MRAFSTTELLIVMAIIAILGGLAAVGYRNYVAVHEIKNFAYELAHYISEGIYIARRDGERVILEVSESVSDARFKLAYDIDKDNSPDSIIIDKYDSNLQIVRNDLNMACETGFKCIVFMSVGLPKIGAAAEEIHIQHKAYGGLVYCVKLRGIVGVPAVGKVRGGSCVEE